MSSLREIKDRISSVRSTLKITGAMKLVASAKLRKAQAAAGAMLPYEQTLEGILSRVAAASGGKVPDLRVPSEEDRAQGRTAVVVIASNSSLCGSFNANVIRAALGVLSGEGECDVFALGRKASEALRKAGYASAGDYNDLVARPSFEKAAGLASALADAYREGRYDKVVLVHNHFISSAVQKPVVESFLPFGWEMEDGAVQTDAILEPSAGELLSALVPKVLEVKMYAALLDSVASEHAARTVAMQTATDNAEDLLSDLTLEYNKGRQQKITSEILDLLGGKAE